jgi:hypothetical protein
MHDAKCAYRIFAACKFKIRVPNLHLKRLSAEGVGRLVDDMLGYHYADYNGKGPRRDDQD